MSRIRIVTLVMAAALALPATGGARELLRYRTPDGREGIVDDPALVPPGAELLSRRAPRGPGAAGVPADAPAPGPPGPGSATPLAPPAAAAEADAGTEEAATAERREADRAAAARCVHEGLSRTCSRADLERVDAWRGQARVVGDERRRADAAFEGERADYEACERSGFVVACSRRALDRAEEAVRRAEDAEERLVDACRRDACLPGWLREEPGAAEE